MKFGPMQLDDSRAPYYQTDLVRTAYWTSKNGRWEVVVGATTGRPHRWRRVWLCHLLADGGMDCSIAPVLVTHEILGPALGQCVKVVLSRFKDHEALDAEATMERLGQYGRPGTDKEGGYFFDDVALKKLIKGERLTELERGQA